VVSVVAWQVVVVVSDLVLLTSTSERINLLLTSTSARINSLSKNSARSNSLISPKQ